jgi:hypothetical protein
MFKLQTLGSKAKIFKWEYECKKGITIHRDFKNQSVITKFSINEINKIKEYLSTKRVTCLANSVAKMRNGTEKDGLGNFVYKNLHRSITDAQAVSQLAAIFVKIGIFESNGKSINIELKVNTVEWDECLSRYKEEYISKSI